MKYFLDTEFLEGTQKTLFGNTKPTIDLISIGIKCEDGREYYAISKDFNLKEAWNRFDVDKHHTRNYKPKEVYWLRDNVLKPIFRELRAKEVEEYNVAMIRNVVLDFPGYSFCLKQMKRLINKYGKTNKQIAEEIKDFVYDKEDILYNHKDCKVNHVGEVRSNIQFYGYYCDYDWVVFCWLFGKMIDLPTGFPELCIDLKQILDEKSAGRINVDKYHIDKKDWILNHENYPKQTNEHNALADAKWNFELYKFLQTI